MWEKLVFFLFAFFSLKGMPNAEVFKAVLLPAVASIPGRAMEWLRLYFGRAGIRAFSDLLSAEIDAFLRPYGNNIIKKIRVDSLLNK